MDERGDQLPNFYTWLFGQLRRLPHSQLSYLLAMGTQSIAAPEDSFQLFTRIHKLVIGWLASGERVETYGIKKVFWCKAGG
ncbi:hypothetical protein V2W45_793241 [Cenococcum geophilum]